MHDLVVFIGVDKPTNITIGWAHIVASGFSGLSVVYPWICSGIYAQVN